MGKTESPEELVRRGDELRKQGRYEDALMSYEVATVENKKFSLAYYRMGNLSDELGMDNKAINYYNKAIKHNKRFKEAYYDRGIAYIKKERFQDALQDFEKILKFYPDFAPAYYGRGVVLKNLEKYEESLQDYNKALELDSNFTDVYIARGNVLYLQNKLKDALEDYNAFLKKQPTKGIAYFLRGDLFVEMGKPKKALADYDQALQFEEHNSDLHFARGNVLLSLKNYEAAKKSFEESIRLDPELIKTCGDLVEIRFQDFLRQAQYLYEQKNYKQAIEYFDRAFRKKESDNSSTQDTLNKEEEAHIFYQRGMAYLRMNKYLEAGIDFSRAISLQPNNLEYHILKADCCLHEYRYDDAICALSDAIQQAEKGSQDLIRCYQKRASIYTTTNEENEAIKDYQVLLNICDQRSEDFSETLSGLGYAYCRVQSYTEVVKLLEPHLDLVKKTFGLPEHLCEGYEGVKNFKQLLELSSQMFQQNPENSFWLEWQARANSGLEKYEQAIDNCQQALKLMSQDFYSDEQDIGWVHANIGYIQEKQQNYEMALASFTKCSKLIDIETAEMGERGKLLEFYEHRMNVHKELGKEKLLKKDQKAIKKIKRLIEEYGL